MRGAPIKQSKVCDVIRVSFPAHHLLNDGPIMPCDVGPPCHIIVYIYICQDFSEVGEIPYMF